MPWPKGNIKLIREEFVQLAMKPDANGEHHKNRFDRLRNTRYCDFINL